MRLISAVFAASVLVAAPADAAGQPMASTEQGRILVVRLCAQCHGIDKADRSPHAAAPPLRRFEPRVDLDNLEQRLREGILAGHPDMPMFKLSRQEAHSVVLYLRAIRAD